MHIGDLRFEVTRDGPPAKLVVLGRLYGLESLITLEQLEELDRYLAGEAARWRAEGTPPPRRLK